MAKGLCCRQALSGLNVVLRGRITEIMRPGVNFEIVMTYLKFNITYHQYFEGLKRKHNKQNNLNDNSSERTSPAQISAMNTEEENKEKESCQPHIHAHKSRFHPKSSKRHCSARPIERGRSQIRSSHKTQVFRHACFFFRRQIHNQSDTESGHPSYVFIKSLVSLRDKASREHQPRTDFAGLSLWRPSRSLSGSQEDCLQVD